MPCQNGGDRLTDAWWGRRILGRQGAQRRGFSMSIAFRLGTFVQLVFLLVVVAAPARAAQYLLAASGTTSSNTSGDATIPIGTPWSFELTYDTTAPDLDFELVGSADPTYGRFTNTSAPPALRSFHYQAGGYEVMLDDPADFGTGSEMLVTFTTVHALDINIFAPRSSRSSRVGRCHSTPTSTPSRWLRSSPATACRRTRPSARRVSTPAP